MLPRASPRINSASASPGRCWEDTSPPGRPFIPSTSLTGGTPVWSLVVKVFIFHHVLARRYLRRSARPLAARLLLHVERKTLRFDPTLCFTRFAAKQTAWGSAMMPHSCPIDRPRDRVNLAEASHRNSVTRARRAGWSNAESNGVFW